MDRPFRITPHQRLPILKEAINNRGFIRCIEAHSGLSALIAETARSVVDGQTIEFDGIWESSLTDSASKGLPDASIVGTESRLHTINEIIGVSTKPIIVDGDTGGEPGQFQFLIENLERMGVSAVIIEDKVFPKRNSLDNSAAQTLEDPEIFARKIAHGKRVTLNEDFMIIARIESLIAGTGVKDALIRAEHYIRAGVDGIMIHSNQREPSDLFEFVKEYDPLCSALGRRPILVGVPTTYNQYSDQDLADLGFNIVIHANQLLRASHKAMEETADIILKTGSSKEVDPICSPVSEIFRYVGLDRVIALDKEQEETLRLSVVIPTAGKDPIFPEIPKSLIPVAGRPILDHQLEAIRKSGFKQIVIVRGHKGELFNGYSNVTLCDNENYLDAHSLESLMAAVGHMDAGFLLVYADILFDPAILGRLINSGKDIVLAIDNSYSYHKHEIDKKLDLVVTKKRFDAHYRRLQPSQATEIVRVGKEIEAEVADYEFIGLAYFSQQGAEALRQVYERCAGVGSTPFHEATDFHRASITDIIQEMIDTGFSVHGHEVNKGWIEIHSPGDVEVAEREIKAVPSGVSSLWR